VFGNDHLELIPHLATLSDPFVQQIGFALKTSLKLMEKRSSICRCDRPCLVVHLLARYSTHSRQIKSSAGGFTQAQWKQIVDFIHANLDRNIHLTELAGLCNSVPIILLMCSKSTHTSPHQYLIRCRIERAKQLMAMGNLSIADIAQTVGLLARTFHLPLQTACRRDP